MGVLLTNALVPYIVCLCRQSRQGGEDAEMNRMSVFTGWTAWFMGAGAAGYNWVEAPAVLSSEVGLGFGLADGNFPYPNSVSDGVHPVAVVAGVCRPVADRVRREEPL